MPLQECHIVMAVQPDMMSRGILSLQQADHMSACWQAQAEIIICHPCDRQKPLQRRELPRTLTLC